MLAFLTSPLSKIIAVLVLLSGLAYAGSVVVHNHDNAVRAVMQASADKTIAAAQEVAHAHEVAALQAQASDDAARAAASQDLWKKTHAYGTTQTCLNSPAVRALLDGLRGNAESADGARTSR